MLAQSQKHNKLSAVPQSNVLHFKLHYSKEVLPQGPLIPAHNTDHMYFRWHDMGTQIMKET